MSKNKLNDEEITKKHKNINRIFNNIEAYLTEIGKYDTKYDTILKDKDNVYLQKRFINWIYNTYKGNGKKNKEYETDIYKVKNLYKELGNIEKIINETQTENDNKKNIVLKNIEKFKKFYTKHNIDTLQTEEEKQQEAAQQQQQQHKQEMEQQQQQYEQEMKQQQQQHEQYNAERNRIENERNANIKNKAYEEGKEEGSKHSVEEIRKILAEDRRIEAERNQAQKDYIMSKVRDGIYKLPKQKIVEIVKKDIEDKKITTDDPEKMADTIYWESVKFINKHKRTIARLSTLQGYNPTQFEQLPPTVHQAVNDYITDKWEEDIARKNRKYLLPKDLPRWERAVQQHNVNPMLGRGAWSN